LVFSIACIERAKLLFGENMSRRHKVALAA
jgi:hypothetical protein